MLIFRWTVTATAQAYCGIMLSRPPSLFAIRPLCRTNRNSPSSSPHFWRAPKIGGAQRSEPCALATPG